jgi:hypothetical protein
MIVRQAWLPQYRNFSVHSSANPSVIGFCQQSGNADATFLIRARFVHYRSLNMHCTKLFSILATLVIAGVWLLPPAKADNWNELTRLSFSQPVEIPGHHVLPAGTYWFELANLETDRNVVTIYSADWSHVYDTVMTVPTYRTHHIGRIELTFAERPHNQPRALMAWYYPGRMTGHEFIYSSQREQRLSRDPKQDLFVPALTVRASVRQ